MKVLMRLTRKKGDIALTNIEIPKADNNWVVVRVHYAGLCGSDILNINREIPEEDRIKPPVIIGHEGSGVIHELGSKVKGLEVGQRVCFQTRAECCGTCYFCRTGNTNLCSYKKGIGSAINGTFAEYIKVPAESIISIPDFVSLDIAALLEPLACSTHLVNDQARCCAEDNVAVIGVGAIGILSAITAKHLGAKVTLFGTKRSSKRANLAKQYDIDVFCGDEAEIIDFKNEVLGSFGYDIVFDCAGTPISFKTALALVRKNGKIALGSAPLDPFEIQLNKIFAEQINIISGASQIRKSWLDALEILVKYNDTLKPLVECKYTIDEWEKAIEALKNRLGVKILIKP